MRSRTSLPGLLTALALLAGQAVTALHMVVVEHHRCVLHGELIETGTPGGLAEPPARGSVASQAAPSPSEPSSLAAAGEHHHDHCGIGLLTRAASVSPEARSDAARSGVAVVSNPPCALPPASYVLLLAPKTSPPSVPV